MPVTPGVSLLSTFAFQSSIMKRTYFFFLVCVLILEGLVGLHRTVQLSMHAFIGEENGNPLQYSFLENPRDRGAW